MFTPWDWMSQLLLSIDQNPEEVDFDTSERMDLITKRGQAGKEQELLPSMSLYRLLVEGLALIKVVPSPVKTQIKGM